jgi:hypothetical protein
MIKTIRKNTIITCKSCFRDIQLTNNLLLNDVEDEILCNTCHWFFELNGYAEEE